MSTYNGSAYIYGFKAEHLQPFVDWFTDVGFEEFIEFYKPNPNVSNIVYEVEILPIEDNDADTIVLLGGAVDETERDIWVDWYCTHGKDAFDAWVLENGGEEITMEPLNVEFDVEIELEDEFAAMEKRMNDAPKWEFKDLLK